MQDKRDSALHDLRGGQTHTFLHLAQPINSATTVGATAILVIRRQARVLLIKVSVNAAYLCPPRLHVPLLSLNAPCPTVRLDVAPAP